MSELRTSTIEQTVTISAEPVQVYRAIMSPKKHTEFTGEAAEGSSEVGGTFKAYGGYITAKNLVLEKARTIIQEWTTTEWPDGYPPSRLEIHLTKVKGGTELRMIHSQVPAEQAEDYAKGWQEHYWVKLQDYFRARKARKKP
jgi:activator of HSP90 ATPase